MPKIVTQDGVTIRATTWESLLAMVRSYQMRPMTEDQLRDELAKRAFILTGREIDVDGTAESLFREMARVGMIELIEDEIPEQRPPS